MKICVCMWYDDNIKQYADINLKVNQLYCEKYSYEISVSDKRFFVEKHVSWEKLPFLYNTLISDKYDYVVWIDADAFFYIDSPPIENVIKKHPDENFIFSADKLKNPHSTFFGCSFPDINCGFIITKNTDYSKNFLQEWYSKQHKTLLKKVWEQGVLWNLYNNNYLNIQNESIILPYNVLQHFHEVNTSYCKKYGLHDRPFIKHITGRPTEERYQISKNYLESISKKNNLRLIIGSNQNKDQDILKNYAIDKNLFPVTLENNYDGVDTNKIYSYVHYLQNLNDEITDIIIFDNFKNIKNFLDIFPEKYIFPQYTLTYLGTGFIDMIGKKKNILKQLIGIYETSHINNIYYNENNERIDNFNCEFSEQTLCYIYINPNDTVLELGARYGTVSCIINRKLNNKKNQIVVEPDMRVWDALIQNRMRNNCEFSIVQGFISKKKLNITDLDNCDGYNVCSIEAKDSLIPSYSLDEIKKKFNMTFNVLVADCEGFLEAFLDENPELFQELRMIIFEKDKPELCNYDKIIQNLKDNNFIQHVDGFQNVFIKH